MLNIDWYVHLVCIQLAQMTPCLFVFMGFLLLFFKQIHLWCSVWICLNFFLAPQHKCVTTGAAQGPKSLIL